MISPVRGNSSVSFDLSIEYNNTHKYAFPDIHDRIPISNDLHIGKLSEYNNEFERLTQQQLKDHTVRGEMGFDGKKYLKFPDGSFLKGEYTFIVKHTPDGRVLRAWPLEDEKRSRLVNHSTLADDNKPDDGFNGVQYAGEMRVPLEGRFDFLEHDVTSETGHYKTPDETRLKEDEAYADMEKERYKEIQELTKEYNANMMKFFEDFAETPSQYTNTDNASEKGYGKETFADLLGEYYVYPKEE